MPNCYISNSVPYTVLQATLWTRRGHGIRHVQQIRGAHASGRLPSRVYTRFTWACSSPRRCPSIFPKHYLSEFGRICECFPPSRPPTQRNNRSRLRLSNVPAYAPPYTSWTLPLPSKRNTRSNQTSQFFHASLTRTLQVSSQRNPTGEPSNCGSKTDRKRMTLL